MSAPPTPTRAYGPVVPLALVLLAWLPVEAAAQNPPQVLVQSITVDGKPVTTVDGVRVTPPGQSRGAVQSLSEQDQLQPGSMIEVPARTVIVLKTLNDTELTLRPGSRMRLDAVSGKGESFTQFFGEAWFTVVKTLDFFEVAHDRFLAAVKGTQFTVSVDDQNVEFGWVSGEFDVSRDVGVTVGGLPKGGFIGDVFQRDTVVVTEDVSADHRAVNHRRDPDEYLPDFRSNDELEQYFRDQLAEDERSGDRTAISEGLTNLGTALVSVGRPAEAIPCHQRSLALHLELHPDGVHPAIASDYAKLGAAYSARGERGDSRRSIESYERARKLLIALYPSGVHPDIAVTATSIGREYDKLGESRVAIGYYEQSLTLIPLLYPPSDGVDLDPTAAEAMAANLGNIGSAYIQLKDSQRAIDYLQRALSMHLQLYPDGLHANLARDYLNLGVQHHNLKEYRQAVDSYDQALDQLLRLYPDGVDPSLADTYRTLYRNLASAWTMLGDRAMADEYTRRARDVADRLKQ